MSDGLPDDVAALAEEYLATLGDDGDDDPEELREELEYWEEQVDEFEEGTPMHEMAVEERDDWRERLDALNSRGERREELGAELLTRASTEFAPRDEWLDSAVIEALSHALLGRRRDRLLVEGFSLPEDADELSKRDMVAVAKTVQAVAADAVGEDDRVAALWDTLDTGTRRSITATLARHRGPLSAEEISDELGEEGTNRPGSNIRKVRGVVQMQPYHTEDDGYRLSLVGEYVWKEHGPEQSVPEADGDEASGEAVPADGDPGDSSDDDGERTEGGVDLSSFEVRE